MTSAGTRKCQKLARKATVDFDLTINITAINGHRTVAQMGGGGGGWGGVVLSYISYMGVCDATRQFR